MPIYQCEECGCVDNTARTNYWVRNRKHLISGEYLGRALCSACGPNLYLSGEKTPWGQWHNAFKRQYLPFNEWLFCPMTRNLIHKETGSTNYKPYLKETPWPKVEDKSKN